MMKLSKAAAFFDRLTCQDAYGTATFKGQFNLFDDATRDGLGSVRRILSVAPAVSMPVRRVIRTGDKVWLVGESHPDYFGNAEIRRKYTLHQADGLATTQSFAEILEDSPGTTAYAARVWVKSAKQVDVSSEIFDVFDIYFTSAESVPNQSVVTLDGLHFLVHESYPTEGGFLAAHASELPVFMSSVTFNSRTYNPLTDAWATTLTQVDALRIRWQDHFRYFTQYSEKYEAGDVQFILLQSTTAAVKAGDTLVNAGQTYSVVAAYSEGDVWSIHARPA